MLYRRGSKFLSWLLCSPPDSHVRKQKDALSINKFLSSCCMSYLLPIWNRQRFGAKSLHQLVKHVKGNILPSYQGNSIQFSFDCRGVDHCEKTLMWGLSCEVLLWRRWPDDFEWPTNSDFPATRSLSQSEQYPFPFTRFDMDNQLLAQLSFSHSCRYFCARYFFSLPFGIVY